MTQGGGFTSGEDFVAARVSIDVPTEGIQSLREMSQAIDRFRTATESAGRSSASFVGYIQQLIQAGNQATEVHRNLAAQLERTAVRDRDLDRQVAEEWSAADQEIWQRLDESEKHRKRASRSVGRSSSQRSTRQ